MSGPKKVAGSRKPTSGRRLELSAVSIERALADLPARPEAAKFLKGYLNTELRVLGLTMPQQRELFKQMKTSFDGNDAKAWYRVWAESDLFESMSLVIFFFERWALERKRAAAGHASLVGGGGRTSGSADNKPKRSKGGGRGIYDPLWPYLMRMVSRLDNWAHSDGLSALISAAVEENRDARLSVLKTWNRSPSPWKRRQSIVSLHFYSRFRKKPLSSSIVLPMIKRLVDDPHFYVQRGVGWALRENFNADPKRTLAFIEAHAPKLSPIAFSAATEKLSPGAKARIKKLRSKR